MENPIKKSDTSASLRQRAEEKFQKNPRNASKASEHLDNLILIQELEIHQIELEMQNEQLHQDKENIQAGLREYTELYDFSPIGYMTLDTHGVILHANLTIANLLDAQRPRLIQQRFVDFICSDSRPVFDEFLKHAFESKGKAFCEVEIITGADHKVGLPDADGHKPCFVRIESCLAGSGKQCRTAIIDITARKQAEHDREKIREQLIQSQKVESIGRLAGGIAHDFNNLLTPIIYYTTQILEESKKGSRIHEDLSIVLEAAQRANEVVSQLLSYGRKKLMKLLPVHANKMIQNITKVIQRLTREDIIFKIILDPVADDLLVNVDTTQIQQVIINLVINARDAMDNGGKITLTTSLEEVTISEADDLPEGKPGSYFVIQVSDTGHGMDANVLSRLFEPFFTTKDIGKGTGLGLSTAMGIIRQHDGLLGVTSTPGDGSCFRIYLPLVASTGEQPDHQSTLTHPVPYALPHKKTILLVEDNMIILTMCRKILIDSGFNVYTAMDGESALALSITSDHPVDLLLTDVVMPKMNGQELYKGLKQYWPSLKVVFMSGYPGPLLEGFSVDMSMSNFLEKPFCPSDLLGKVHGAFTDLKVIAPTVPR